MDIKQDMDNRNRVLVFTLEIYIYIISSFQIFFWSSPVLKHSNTASSCVFVSDWFGGPLIRSGASGACR